MKITDSKSYRFYCRYVANFMKNHYCWWYAVGFMLWLFLFKWVFFGSLFGKVPYFWSHGLCLFILVINFLLHCNKYEAKEYDTEERIYEYVERNAYYLVMAVTIFLLISAQGENKIFSSHNIDFPLIVYSQAVSIIFCVIIIALYWMPTAKGKTHWLVHLRHAKTVLLTYALSLFFIGPIEIIFKLRHSF